MSPEHGLKRYRSLKCRCDVCRAANAKYQRDRVASLVGSLAENDPRHGTANGYINFKCRCAPCTAAWAEAHRTYMQSAPAQQERHRVNQRRLYAAKRRRSDGAA